MLQEHRKRRRHLLFAAVFLLAQTINRYRAEYFLQTTDTTDLFDEYLLARLVHGQRVMVAV
jgi:hypothetical protein